MAPKRILVVDDEAAVAEVLQYLLEDEGYVVVTVTDPQDAIVKAAEVGFAAAVIDVSMGKVSGIAVAQALRAGPLTTRIPIIMLTGLAERLVREQFTGYDLFVSKGADLNEFVEKLALLIASDNDEDQPRLQRRLAS